MCVSRNNVYMSIVINIVEWNTRFDKENHVENMNTDYGIMKTRIIGWGMVTNFT